MRSQKLQELGW
uniref:Histonelysine Nmethyltransferase SETMARlike [Ceratitis capitata] n=1 Tax=Lepeophtheirus salmonis TaxID=72036 RepID=A0A0K2VF98_LEPSM